MDPGNGMNGINIELRLEVFPYEANMDAISVAVAAAAYESTRDAVDRDGTVVDEGRRPRKHNEFMRMHCQIILCSCVNE